MYSFINYNEQGIDAQVYAVNQTSSEDKLSWVFKMYNCFCVECCDIYKSSYYVEISNPTPGPCQEVNPPRTRFV